MITRERVVKSVSVVWDAYAGDYITLNSMTNFVMSVNGWGHNPPDNADKVMRILENEIRAGNMYSDADRKGLYRHNPNQPVKVQTASSSGAVNDHVCPSCKNDRCSKTERSCWKCGGPL